MMVSPFTDEATKAQRGQAICLRSQSGYWQNQDLSSGMLMPDMVFSSTKYQPLEGREHTLVLEPGEAGGAFE